MRYIAVISLLVATVSAQNAPSANKGRHLDIPAISREANGAVVSIIMADNKGQPIAQGSGFVVTRNGLVVTNYHVIKNGTSAMIKLPDGSFFNVDGVLAFDDYHDIAVIKAHGVNFKTVALGDSDRLQVGDEVVAIGSPLSLESTVSNGIVSGFRIEKRNVFDEMAGKGGLELLQITAPISHGSSGGPLFNMAGEVVGITSAALIDGENLNFAVPINDVKPMLAWGLSKASAFAFPNEPEAKGDGPGKPTQTEDGGPPLAETEQWMNEFTAAYARLKNSATVLQFEQCDVVEHDFIGENLNLAGPFEQATEIRGSSYMLSDIDPAQISIKSNSVVFANTDARQSINHSDIFYSANWVVIFDNSEHAAQFAKAFRHAVELCGGKKSVF